VVRRDELTTNVTFVRLPSETSLKLLCYFEVSSIAMTPKTSSNHDDPNKGNHPASTATVTLDKQAEGSDAWQAGDLFSKLDSAQSLLNSDQAMAATPSDASANQIVPEQALSELGLPEQGQTTDDSSIESYMAELMKRCNGYSSEPAVETPDQTPAAQTGRSTERPAAPPESTCTSGNSPGAPRRPAAAPERGVAMHDLRELANINSRNQLDACIGQRIMFEMNDRLKLSLIAMLTSFAMIGFAKSTSSLAFLCALMSLMVAIVWSLKFMALGKRLEEICGTNVTSVDPAVQSEEPPQSA
jgi:hypothetical protein